MFWTTLRDWLSRRSTLRRHFRFPALAEANKALIAIEQEVVEFGQISDEMELYRDAQTLPERGRDSAYIPIYLKLEQFVVNHPPPLTREALTKAQLRQKIGRQLDLNQMNEGFRLIFLPPNEQAYHLLKIGVLPLLNYLLASVGSSQLTTLIKDITGSTPLKLIKVGDDGIIFDDVNVMMRQFSQADILAAYQRLYRGLFREIQNLFGEQEATDLVTSELKKMTMTYDLDLVTLYAKALPIKVALP